MTSLIPFHGTQIVADLIDGCSVFCRPMILSASSTISWGGTSSTLAMSATCVTLMSRCAPRMRISVDRGTPDCSDSSRTVCPETARCALMAAATASLMSIWATLALCTDNKKSKNVPRLDLYVPETGSNVLHMETTSYPEAVAKAVRKAMDSSGNSVHATALKSGIPSATMQRRLTAPTRYPFTVAEIDAIAQATEKSTSALLIEAEVLAARQGQAA